MENHDNRDNRENRHADALLVKIREAKETQGLTNDDLAEMTGVNETTVSRILSGAGKRPSYDSLVTMAAALHISVDKILYAVLPDEEVTPKVETVVENYANVIKIKDDLLATKDRLIEEKESEITDKDETIDKLHAEMETNRVQRRKLASVLFVQSATLAVILILLVIYVVTDIAHGHFGFMGV